jgi:hypothetical protein
MSDALAATLTDVPPQPGAGRSLMRDVRIGEVLIALLLTGCAGIGRAPPPESPQVGAASGATTSSLPRDASPLPPVTPPERVTGAAEPTVPPVAPIPSGAAAPGLPKPVASTPKVPAKAAAASPLPSPAAPRPKTDAAVAPPTAVAKPEAPPLDLKSLEARLKETKAIGVFTKLTVKNQVDELLDRFRAFYQGRLQTTLAELRRSYDMLVLKVLALLQDADPQLANAINASREAIWGILSNRERFDKV